MINASPSRKCCLHPLFYTTMFEAYTSLLFFPSSPFFAPLVSLLCLIIVACYPVMCKTRDAVLEPVIVHPICRQREYHTVQKDSNRQDEARVLIEKKTVNQHDEILHLLRQELAKKTVSHHDDILHLLRQELAKKTVSQHDDILHLLRQELATKTTGNREEILQLVRQELIDKPLCNHEEMIDELRQELFLATNATSDTMGTSLPCGHEGTIDALRQEHFHATCEYQRMIAALQQELYQKSLYPACNHEGMIASLQQELYQKSLHPVCNHEGIIASLQQELYQKSLHPVCNHESTIASLQLELYYAKTELAKRTVRRNPEESENRIESILLKRLDSKGIPDKKMLETIRLIEPNLRRADLYKCLQALKKKKLILERPDRVWVKVTGS